MRITIALFILLLTCAGCETTRFSEPVHVDFYPKFRGEGFCIELVIQNQMIPPGGQATISTNMPCQLQLYVMNCLPDDVFMRVETRKSVTRILPETESGGRAPVKMSEPSFETTKDEFTLLPGTLKTRKTYRQIPGSYYCMIKLPSDLSHYRVDGDIILTYYIVGDSQRYTQHHEYSFTVKREDAGQASAPDPE